MLFYTQLFGVLIDPIRLGVGEVDWETRSRSYGRTYRPDFLYRFRLYEGRLLTYPTFPYD